MRTLRVLVVSCVLVASLPPSMASLGDPPPLRDDALRVRIEDAIDKMERDGAELAASNPAIFPLQALQGNVPMDAGLLVRLDLAAKTLADHRLRVRLEFPQGANNSLLPMDDVMARARAWHQPLQANSTRWIDAVETARVPEPGSDLEDVLFWHLPAFDIRARKGEIDMAISDIPRLVASGRGIGPVVSKFVEVEARHAVWEYLPPPPFPDIQDETDVLNFLDMERMQQGISYVKGSSFARPANDLSNYAAIRHQYLAAVAFLSHAERSHVTGTSATRAVLEGGDVRDLLQMEYDRMAPQNASLLSIQALEEAHFLLSTVPGTSSSTLENVTRMAEALGKLGGLRLLRGLPILEPTEETGKFPGTGTGDQARWIVAGVAAAGLVMIGYVAWRRRSRRLD